jgi:hypothetical protein
VETIQGDTHVRIRTIALLVVLTLATFGCVQQPNVPGYTSRVTDPYAAKRWSSPGFTTAHASFADAAKHFLSIRPKPQQPIEFPHDIHTSPQVGLECNVCHSGVTRGPNAGIPTVSVCMGCHEDTGDPKDPRIQSLRDHSMRGEDLAWQRVYGFNEESHVRFNHSPHIRAKVECATCHGDVTKMTVAQRAIDHTMNFCITCHKQKGASNDCLTCHY